jgi:hypothetical protein
MSMRLPNQTLPVKRSIGIGRIEGAIRPSDCDVLKAVACAAAVGLCAGACVTGAEPACIACFAALGQTSCVDCL